ncbi:MAG: sulfatase-like hydrolase/transferase [Bryobacter sp.]|jgi:arylsulfatase A-like enzyme|nr:sulfatase-like hydrolase/transferase [Bryobacter sp. CoA8 C33]
MAIRSGLTRRQWLATAGTSLAGASRKQPNFLFIMADDLGYADLSCYGRRDYSTPHLDRLAREGMRFTNAYANACVCSPTRVALMTGRYQQRLPVGLEEPLATRPRLNLGLPPGHPTLASVLRGAGYRTALVGKWHLGYLPDYSPEKSGYESFYGFRSGGVDYYTHRLGATAESAVDLWDGDRRLEQPGYLTDLLGNRAVAQLREFGREKKPFLMNLHFSAPHWPWQTPEDGQADPAMKSLTNFEGGSEARYARMVGRMDEQVGRVLDVLRQTGLDRDTVVIFTSDNGGERYSDTWPYTGRKTELLEGGLRVPAIVRWPRKVKSGGVVRQPAMTMDWMPTFLAMAGVEGPRGYAADGIDLSPWLTGAAPVRERAFFWRHRYAAQRAMREGKWKWLSIRGNTFLFDLEADPQEKANRKTLERDREKRMAAEYARWEAGMLPENPQGFTHGLGAGEVADRYANPLP